MGLTTENAECAKAPIGVFDSGIGGLTVAREIMRQIPNESIVYFGDTARLPYGSKSKETVTRYSRQIVRFLKTHHVKTIVAACNTVSAYALEVLEQESDIPIIGVVKPGAKVAAATTRNKKIGVIATEATIGSGVYNRYIEELNHGVTIWEKACPLFVPLVEEGLLEDPVTDEIARRYLTELIDLDIDTLILGCTHYPLLRSVIASYMGPSVALVDSGAAAADAVRSMLVPAGPGRGTTRYFVSDDPASFRQLASLFLQEDIAHPAELVDISSYGI